MKLKALIVALAFSTTAFAHTGDRSIGEHPPADCQQRAAQEAWGAYAQTLGAPLAFKYVSYNRLHSIFFGQEASIPRDGIYVLADMDADTRTVYERNARVGWNWAKADKGTALLNRHLILALRIAYRCGGSEKS